MPIKYLKDEEGESIRVLDIDGYYLPTVDKIIPKQEEVVRSMRTWKAKDDDVLLCAYPKSGTHWLWEVASMLLNGSADRINLIKETAMLEVIPQPMYDNIKSPRVLNSHIYFRMLPEDFVKRKCKIVYILRNPKDVAVSFFNHHFKLLEYEYSGKWENYIHRFLKGQVDYGSWFDYTLDWEKVIQDNPDYPIHIMSYEDMKKDDKKEIKQLARFLGIKEDEELIKSIAEACDFERMKKEKTPLEIATADEWRDKEPGMYRKGQVGDWKNWFTVAQNEFFDTVYAERMKNSKFQFRYMFITVGYSGKGIDPHGQCTNWLWEVTSMLLNGSAERIQARKETAMLELVTRETYDNIKYPRVLNSHMYFHMLPEDLVKQICKIVHVLRNPKDVAVSFYNHHVKLVAYEYNGKWENYIHRFIAEQVDFGSWFEFSLDWENVIQDHPGYPIHVVRYEEMKEDSIKETRCLTRFLDVKADEELIQSISNACDFDSMQQEKETVEKTMAIIWKDQKPGMY